MLYVYVVPYAPCVGAVGVVISMGVVHVTPSFDLYKLNTLGNLEVFVPSGCVLS